jgi:hypothetical protein
MVSYVFGHAFMPPINVDRALALGQKFAKFQHPRAGYHLGKCSVCGAVFNYGDVWLHEPSQELITIGHDCADKYEMMADRSAFELECGNFKAARAVEIKKAREAEKRQKFLDANEGLESAFNCQHRIVQDIKSKFSTYGSLSEKQVAFVLKLAAEASKPAVAKVEEAHTPAPEGRVSFMGLVVASKSVDTEWGVQIKITVKVETTDGSWLAWGTCPASILSECANEGGVRGKRVEITATLKRGRDEHFALMSRPNGRVVPGAPGMVEATA